MNIMSLNLMKSRAWAGALIVGCALIVGTCNSTSGVSQQTMSNQDIRRDLSALTSARIFFGHQSVGVNILRGVRLIAQESQAPMPTIAALGPDAAAPRGPVLVESHVGQNTKPESKMQDFERRMERVAASGAVNVALMKFCYVDFGPDTDVQRVFDEYQSMLTRLRARYPQTAFVPVTTPLTVGRSWRGLLKKWIQGVDPTAANVRRNEFNERLRHADAKTELFDLAAVESTRPDGGRNTFDARGREYEQLIGSYSSDGGHLNDAGARIAAREMVRILASAVANRPHLSAQAALAW